MKSSSALVFLVLAAGCLAEMGPKEVEEKCMKEVGAADREELGENEDKRKCFFKCLMQNADLMEADGTLSYDNAEKFANEKISDEDKRKNFLETFKLCADKVTESEKSSPCDKATIMFDCFLDNSKELQEMMNKAMGS